MGYREECPVCGREMTVETETIDWGGPICEQYSACPGGCYTYEFSYGYTTVYVSVAGHRLRFGWGYSDGKDAVRAETDAVETACEAARSIIGNEDKAGRP